MKYPLSLEDLALWEDWLNRLNQECLVPSSTLNKTLSSNDRDQVLQRQVKSHQNIPYHSVQSHLSKRYINEAWIWAGILQQLPAQTIYPNRSKTWNLDRAKASGLDDRKSVNISNINRLAIVQPRELSHRSKSKFLTDWGITELCAGASIVIDLALSYIDFDQSFTKIDYQSWDHLDQHEIKKTYRQIFIDLNVITDTESIPKTDMIILNHSIDDLYIGLWNERHQRNYWGEFCDCDRVDASWEHAIQERDLYLPVLKVFIKKIVTRLNAGGYLIIRDYPSAYETHRKHLKRINFTRKLTQSLVEELDALGMVRHTLEDATYPAVQETFFILAKTPLTP